MERPKEGATNVAIMLSTLVFYSFLSFAAAAVLLSGEKSVLSGWGKGRLRAFLEMIYFVSSGVALPSIAAWAAIFAYRQTMISREQFNLSYRMARADACARLYDRIMSPDVSSGRGAVWRISSSYQGKMLDGRGDDASLRRCFVEAVQQIIATDSGRELYDNLYSYIMFLEALGGFVRLGYVSFDDAHFLLEGDFKALDVSLRGYLEHLRERSPDGRACEHALWLITKGAGHVRGPEFPE